MLYTTLHTSSQDYHLRLSARETINLERKMGINPVMVLSNISTNNLPTIDTLITILHACLQSQHHGISLDDCYTIYDQMVDDGKSFADLIAIIAECFKISGLIPKDDDSKN